MPTYEKVFMVMLGGLNADGEWIKTPMFNDVHRDPIEADGQREEVLRNSHWNRLEVTVESFRIVS